MPKCQINNYIFINLFLCRNLFERASANQYATENSSKLQSGLDKRFMARAKSENWLVRISDPMCVYTPTF